MLNKVGKFKIEAYLPSGFTRTWQATAFDWCSNRLTFTDAELNQEVELVSTLPIVVTKLEPDATT